MDYYLNKYIFKKKENENINLNQVPYIMLSNFESLTEKQCLKADKNNKKVYKKLLESVEKAHKEVRNTGLFLNLEAPLPPHPSNRDRFLLWKRRNVNHHVITQSEAVLFLNENGYKLNEHYEAYQAIELSKEIKRNKGIPVDNSEILESKNFDNVYTTQDKNIFRRRSMYGKTQFTNTRNKFNDIVINSDFDEKPKIQEDNIPYQMNQMVPLEPSAPSISGAPSAPPYPENSCNSTLRQNTTNINMYLPNTSNTSNIDNKSPIYPSISECIGKN